MDDLKLAKKAVKKAGKVLRKSYGRSLTVKRKEKHDFVTDIDIKTEQKIIDVLEESGHSIMGEETGMHEAGEKTWIVDPLDGTTNYILNNPAFSSAVALVDGSGTVVVSAIYLPLSDELIYAEKGKGAFINGEKITVSDEDSLDDSFLVYCHGKKPIDSERAIKLYRMFKTSCKDFRQIGSASIEFSMVGRGTAEAFIFPGSPDYDAAPGLLVLEEAGGKITDFNGEEWELGSDTLVASNGKVHEEIIDELEGEF